MLSMLEGSVVTNSLGPPAVGCLQWEELDRMVEEIPGPEPLWSPDARGMQEGCAHLPTAESERVGFLWWCNACGEYFRVTYFDAGMGGYPNYWKRAGRLYRFFMLFFGRVKWKDVFNRGHGRRRISDGAQGTEKPESLD